VKGYRARVVAAVERFADRHGMAPSSGPADQTLRFLVRLEDGAELKASSPAAALELLRRGGARLLEGDPVPLLELDAAQAANLARALFRPADVPAGFPLGG
jgi:hypothetical protein